MAGRLEKKAHFQKQTRLRLDFDWSANAYCGSILNPKNQLGVRLKMGVCKGFLTQKRLLVKIS
jgi:hypothetical protein